MRMGNYLLDTHLLESIRQKIMSNINNLTCVCENCTSAMLLQYYLNKFRSTQLAKLDRLHINAASTRHLQIYKID